MQLHSTACINQKYLPIWEALFHLLYASSVYLVFSKLIFLLAVIKQHYLEMYL